MGLAFFLFFSILNNKVNREGNCGQYYNTKHHIESFHRYSSLSFGVSKYADIVRIETVNPTTIAKDRVNFLANILPIIPTVSVYLAASAKILATTFLLSLFTLKVYHKKETI